MQARRGVNNGVSGRRFLVFAGVVALLTFVAGLALAPTGIGTNFGGIVSFAVHVLVRLGIIVVGSVLWGWVFFTQVADLKLNQIIPTLKARDNLAYGLIAAGIFGVVTLAVANASANTFQLYLYEVLTKGTVGMVLGVVFTVVVAWFLGVRSLDGFNEVFIRDARNNQMVLLLTAIWLGTMYVTMIAR